MKLSEKEVLKSFNKDKKALIKAMGTKSTTDRQLNTMGKQLFGAKYLGTYSQDNIPWKKVNSILNFNNTFAIINTDPVGKPGVHRVALYITAKTVYIWDSYGRNSKALLPLFVAQLKTRKYRFKDSDNDIEQSKKSEICGQLCLAWMRTVKDLGIMNAMKV
jgi:hypothetical protein